MSLIRAVCRLAQVLRAENDALADGDAAAAVRLLPEKQQATTALQAAIPSGTLDKATAQWLADLATENRIRLARAIEVQGRVLEMVAQAARRTAPGIRRYGARGEVEAQKGAVAMTIRA